MRKETQKSKKLKQLDVNISINDNINDNSILYENSNVND